VKSGTEVSITQILVFVTGIELPTSFFETGGVMASLKKKPRENPTKRRNQY
jgi:hypothetical protein